MAFISALHQICQLISGFSSLGFFFLRSILFNSLSGIVLSHPSAFHTVLGSGAVPAEEGGRGGLAGDLSDAPDGWALCLWSLFQYYVSGVGGEQPLYSLPSLPPFSVVNDVLQS